MSGTAGHRGWGHLRKERSGRWSASFIGPDGQRHRAPTTYSQKTLGEAWLGNQRRDIELGTWQPPTVIAAAAVQAVPVTVGEYAVDWLKQRTKLSPRTRAHYEALVRNHIKPGLGDVAVTALTPDMVRRWHSGLDPAKPAPKAHSYGLLRTMMRTAEADDLIAKTPCRIEGATQVPTKRLPVVPSIPEMAVLAASVPDRYTALVLVSAWCGLRFGEVTELRRKDIGDNCEMITVARGVTRRDGRTYIGTPKSGKTRTSVVPPHIRAALKHHLDVHVADRDAEALVFPNTTGGHLNDKVFRDALRPALSKVHRDGLVIHDLRHFAGTQAARVGNLVETMERLGHSTAKASLIYQQVASERPAEIADALSKLAESPELTAILGTDG